MSAPPVEMAMFGMSLPGSVWFFGSVKVWSGTAAVVHGETGMLVRTEGQFASAWASLAIDGRRREALGRAARTRALDLHWSAAVEGFEAVAEEAIK